MVPRIPRVPCPVPSDRTRNAKIDHFDEGWVPYVMKKHDVIRLDISMNHPTAVRFSETANRLEQDMTDKRIRLAIRT